MAAGIEGIDTLCCGGVEFAQDASRSYDRALIKEVVHHLPDEQLSAMFRGAAHPAPPPLLFTWSFRLDFHSATPGRPTKIEDCATGWAGQASGSSSRPAASA
eukprot:SAG25_NODE_366_length_9120_cov_2.274138_2_plen_102_part_00